MPAYDPTLNLAHKGGIARYPGLGSTVAARSKGVQQETRAAPFGRGNSPWRIDSRDSFPTCDGSLSIGAVNGEQPGQVSYARKDQRARNRVPHTPQAPNPSHRLAFADPDFLTRDDLRPVRLQLELLKTEMALAERGIVSTIAMFGSARIPDPETPTGRAGGTVSSYYCVAREFARLMTLRSLARGCRENVICTGGGPGIMEAGNRGAAEAGGVSISLNIVLPHEQAPNDHGTPELSFNFHYFAIRKMHFLMRARAVVVFPGGFGTLDEMFEVLTLVQTGRMKPLPILLFGGAFWREVIQWEALADAGTIARHDLDLFAYVDSASEAVARIETWYGEPFDAATNTMAGSGPATRLHARRDGLVA